MVIVAVPRETPVALPLLSIVRMPASLVAHVITAVADAFVAEYACVCPTTSTDVVGVMPNVAVAVVVVVDGVVGVSLPQAPTHKRVRTILHNGTRFMQPPEAPRESQ